MQDQYYEPIHSFLKLCKLRRRQQETLTNCKGLVRKLGVNLEMYMVQMTKKCCKMFPHQNKAVIRKKCILRVWCAQFVPSKYVLKVNCNNCNIVPFTSEKIKKYIYFSLTLKVHENKMMLIYASNKSCFMN